MLTRDVIQSSLEYLRAAGLADWRTVLFGLERGFLTEGDAVRHAIDQVGDASPPVAFRLAMAGHEHGFDVKAAVEELAREPEPRPFEGALERWQLALLESVLGLSSDIHVREQYIRDVYVALSYPDNMRECDRYYVPSSGQWQIGDVGVSPVRVAERIVSVLRPRLLSK